MEYFFLALMIPMFLGILFAFGLVIYTAIRNIIENNDDALISFIILLFFIGVVGLLFTSKAKAATFEYKNKLVIEAPDYKTAAKLCFKNLNPVFVSEEKALNVIDICANPIKGEVK